MTARAHWENTRIVCVESLHAAGVAASRYARDLANTTPDNPYPDSYAAWLTALADLQFAEAAYDRAYAETLTADLVTSP